MFLSIAMAIIDWIKTVVCMKGLKIGRSKKLTMVNNTKQKTRPGVIA